MDKHSSEHKFCSNNIDKLITSMFYGGKAGQQTKINQFLCTYLVDLSFLLNCTCMSMGNAEKQLFN